MTDFWESVSQGQTFNGLLVEKLNRAHIAQYAGASGDFNSVHVDEPFARSVAGRPAVIAHGMLTMGLTATFVTRLVGHGALRSFGGRFLLPVVPGDRLYCTATVQVVTRQDAGADVVLALETANQAQQTVFRGQAQATHRARSSA
jgi:acyl dehydratase